MSDPISYFWMFVAAVIVLVDLWAIISVFRSEKSDGVKVMWFLGIVIFPVLGLIIWGLFGPRGVKPGSGPTSPEHSKG
ncbi:PLD nuclease N-terminal domain-containing protein [Pseudomonas rubra]|uniref:PLD nuclease N-terminal domain-containing protein n=1 Tax=Pseudomonas rubra TaxID=2942627 RepID=A0ABT5P1Q6_9PSED|nr:PLD nuclease N-terminal domain-containing protein [Pseudomonas rubra]MDD1012209.1 PLD nuclease N-terminal domain-containing protein [Pseudomonas rubra]MDD1038355.1 PLD nuclease N-terminal domain-containing protein [Pseudomonas rubra]MDD1153391.1 PLD nuclease N-terminal domain-containing protein [Pseudomonas rubra]